MAIKSDMEKSWRAFHKEYPFVELELKRLATPLRKRGFTSYGLPALWEVLRYNFNLTLKVSGYTHKLPNGYKAYYARLLMLKYPRELGGFFRVRGMFKNGEPDLRDLL